MNQSTDITKKGIENQGHFRPAPEAPRVFVVRLPPQKNLSEEDVSRPVLYQRSPLFYLFLILPWRRKLNSGFGKKTETYTFALPK